MLTRGVLGAGRQVTVLRDGRTQEIDTGRLVVGDVLLFATGDILPADGMLFQGNEIRHAHSHKLVWMLLCGALPSNGTLQALA